MWLLQKLKSLFGSGNGPRSEDSSASEPTVTVEREPSAASEHAVKGTRDGVADADSRPRGADPDRGGHAPGTGESQDAGGTEDEAGAEPASAAADSGSVESSPPVDEIRGIGPTYAERLGGAGIETVADLADADVETVAAAAEASETRAADWIDRAREH